MEGEEDVVVSGVGDAASAPFCTMPGCWDPSALFTPLTMRCFRYFINTMSGGLADLALLPSVTMLALSAGAPAPCAPL
ncbi:hypothetical protein PHLCEN_2v11619 [Hermanssonia centrifuga]|uniref:Uncharacterized protein n=1 Tax=Hermanssonia centrifuga TaxID=98765 RepID=A0A2R6NJH1_9APHY|nr:hypothetical protein PHLCEN_2v11619 [Hermanssonia centrifuga]